MGSAVARSHSSPETIHTRRTAGLLHVCEGIQIQLSAWLAGESHLGLRSLIDPLPARNNESPLTVLKLQVSLSRVKHLQHQSEYFNSSNQDLYHFPILENWTLRSYIIIKALPALHPPTHTLWTSIQYQTSLGSNETMLQRTYRRWCFPSKIYGNGSYGISSPMHLLPTSTTRRAQLKDYHTTEDSSSLSQTRSTNLDS